MCRVTDTGVVRYLDCLFCSDLVVGVGRVRFFLEMISHSFDLVAHIFYPIEIEQQPRT